MSRANWLIANWEDSDLADDAIPSDEHQPVGLAHRLADAGGSAAQHAADIEVVARLSWTAYVGPVIGLLALLMLPGVVALLFGPATGAVAVLVWLTFAVYRVLLLRSVVLFLDDEGVWVQRGILPWDTGAYGVKWRDLDEAVFFPGFLDWLLRSHTIVLRHRFTKDAEIALEHVAHGDQVVMIINARHARAVEER